MVCLANILAQSNANLILEMLTELKSSLLRLQYTKHPGFQRKVEMEMKALAENAPFSLAHGSKHLGWQFIPCGEAECLYAPYLFSGAAFDPNPGGKGWELYSIQETRDGKDILHHLLHPHIHGGLFPIAI